MPPGSRKRQQPICFRSLALPLANTEEEKPSKDGNGNGGPSSSSDEPSPHFLAALQLVAHVIEPLRKALVHYYVSHRGKDASASAGTKLEHRTLLAFGRLFRDLISPANAASSSAGSLASNGGLSVSSHSVSNNHPSGSGDPCSDDTPVPTDRFFPVLNACLEKMGLPRDPGDATEAVRVVLACLRACCGELPLNGRLWVALLDKAATGLVVDQSLVGRRRARGDADAGAGAGAGVLLQRTHKERCMLWCPHVLPIGDLSRIPPAKTTSGGGGEEEEKEAVPTLQQLLEADCAKRPLSTTARRYYDFDTKPYDFEVEIPAGLFSFGGGSGKNGSSRIETDTENDTKQKQPWKTTRSMRFSALTGYLFLGIDRVLPDPTTTTGGSNAHESRRLDRSELAVPPTLDLTRLSEGQSHPGPVLYDLVGGALCDEGDYVAVLKDHAAAAALAERQVASNKNSNNEKDNDPKNGEGSDSDDDEEDETWKLIEAEETIPMSELDVLEFLKGEGNDDDSEEEDDDSDSDDEGGPCGTLAVYRLRTEAVSSSSFSLQRHLPQNETVFDEMNRLLSDIVLSQVTGSLDSLSTDYYIEEEIYEEEIIEDTDDDDEAEGEDA
ncbi:unnamed protein product [Pseudo-nitzschia multistriata]|uniref:Uncharacterized protein n=1 Tax=Pseudo-nitzschia multistriata TaxID=183589 RepID=A0A448ZGF0_9STRA|nr:unnamed protein product [Pseudo-nitzschia multistriata]